MPESTPSSSDSTQKKTPSPDERTNSDSNGGAYRTPEQQPPTSRRPLPSLQSSQDTPSTAVLRTLKQMPQADLNLPSCIVLDLEKIKYLADETNPNEQTGNYTVVEGMFSTQDYLKNFPNLSFKYDDTPNGLKQLFLDSARGIQIQVGDNDPISLDPNDTAQKKSALKRIVFDKQPELQDRESEVDRMLDALDNSYMQNNISILLYIIPAILTHALRSINKRTTLVQYQSTRKSILTINPKTLAVTLKTTSFAFKITPMHETDPQQEDFFKKTTFPIDTVESFELDQKNKRMQFKSSSLKIKPEIVEHWKPEIYKLVRLTKYILELIINPNTQIRPPDEWMESAPELFTTKDTRPLPCPDTPLSAEAILNREFERRVELYNPHNTLELNENDANYIDLDIIQHKITEAAKQQDQDIKQLQQWKSYLPRILAAYKAKLTSDKDDPEKNAYLVFADQLKTLGTINKECDEAIFCVQLEKAMDVFRQCEELEDSEQSLQYFNLDKKQLKQKLRVYTTYANRISSQWQQINHRVFNSHFDDPTRWLLHVAEYSGRYQKLNERLKLHRNQLENQLTWHKKHPETPKRKIKAASVPPLTQHRTPIFPVSPPGYTQDSRFTRQYGSLLDSFMPQDESPQLQRRCSIASPQQVRTTKNKRPPPQATPVNQTTPKQLPRRLSMFAIMSPMGAEPAKKETANTSAEAEEIEALAAVTETDRLSPVTEEKSPTSLLQRFIARRGPPPSQQALNFGQAATTAPRHSFFDNGASGEINPFPDIGLNGSINSPLRNRVDAPLEESDPEISVLELT